MSTQHTPGTWTACPGRARERYNIETTSTGNDCEPIATLIGPDREANAKLVAAAPELLAALKKWDKFMRDNYDAHEISWWAETEAAIAKATGGTQP
jgi:hypothetical protein